jgi:uncharacterized protein (TIGR03085 family)
MVSSLAVTAPPYDQVVTSLARTERAALADLLDQLGPDEPTLCGDWTTRDLAAHLSVRERRPDALPGVAIKAFAGRTESVQDSYAERDYAELVQLVRSGPGRLSLFSIPGADKFLNTTEYVVHHEDVRRAQEGWQPRALPRRVQDTIWKAVAARAPLSYRGLGHSIELRRTDRPEVAPLVASSGGSAATVSGEPLELLLYSFGRREHAKVTITGDTSAMTALRGADLSV